MAVNSAEDNFYRPSCMRRYAAGPAFVTETKRAVLAPMGDQGRHLSPRARMVRAAAEKRQ